MRDTIVGDGWRWIVIAFGLAASFIMAWLLRLTVRRAKKRKARLEESRRRGAPTSEADRREAMRDRGEIAALIGGTTVCLFVATGTLGVVLDWDSVFRLPFMATALAYTCAGRGTQLRNLLREARSKGT